ncbi:hypothetical protein OGAPHI_003451 [Ogataea philodendri]|uniref:Uncharacterized protein n=1 Tax=Ogataea philodendri TaxID=1378263 RepID=A0A9P8T5V1_9ASCO|nr:uncharacterized protein OGAPHI_003451 [Ogataea philodendri]KAH3666455.1 hypothetical protein OGAPHI_003451 [Ogataea philodendri]
MGRGIERVVVPVVADLETHRFPVGGVAGKLEVDSAESRRGIFEPGKGSKITHSVLCWSFFQNVQEIEVSQRVAVLVGECRVQIRFGKGLLSGRDQVSSVAVTRDLGIEVSNKNHRNVFVLDLVCSSILNQSSAQLTLVVGLVVKVSIDQHKRGSRVQTSKMNHGSRPVRSCSRVF